ncbi:MAG: hypothetical protein ABIP79_11970 [Chitinophagaceae bacterium]
MIYLFYLLATCFSTVDLQTNYKQERIEIKLVNELFRLRNEHKADSAELYFAETVEVYMKYMRNVPRQKITKSDKSFWKAHPKNKFEMTEPVRLSDRAGITTATIIGKEYLDGKGFKYEKIEIKFNGNKKIISYKGFNHNKKK